MEEPPEVTSEKPGSALIIGFYFYISTLEFIFTFLMDIYIKQKIHWGNQPTIGGMIIQMGLILAAVICGYLGNYFHTHPQKAMLLSNRVTKGKTFILFSILLILLLVLFSLIILKPSVIQSVPTQILHKHPTLTGLAVLLVLQTLCALIFLRVRYFDEALPRLFQKLEKLKEKIRTINITNIDLHNFFQKYWAHILVWVIVIIYIVLGPVIYTRYFLKNGKPIELNQALPATTDQIKFAVDSLYPIRINAQDLYNLQGWSYFLGDPDQAKYDRYIVLQSDTRTYFFPVQSMERSDVQKAFKDLNMDLLNSGFSSIISKDAIQPGKYHLGILFKDQSSDNAYYFDSNKTLIRTANQLIRESNNLQP